MVTPTPPGSGRAWSLRRYTGYASTTPYPCGQCAQTWSCAIPYVLPQPRRIGTRTPSNGIHRHSFAVRDPVLQRIHCAQTPHPGTPPVRVTSGTTAAGSGDAAASAGGKTHPAVRLDEPPELVWRASGTKAGGVHPDRGDPRARRLARTVREPTGWRSQDRTQHPRLSQSWSSWAESNSRRNAAVRRADHPRPARIDR